VRRALVIAAALAGLLVGTASAGAAGGDLRVGSPQAFETPNPFRAVEAISVDSYATVYYDQLGGIKLSDQSAEYRNALAKSAAIPSTRTRRRCWRSPRRSSSGRAPASC
jgi:hypothetical protein